MKAIVTKYHGPTNTNGSRVSAQTEGQAPVFVSGDDHDAAMMALAKKLDWHSTWYKGAMPDGKGYVYVQTTRDDKGFET